MGNELRRLKPETITRALVALRAELVRDGGPGLEHVEALLILRGSNLPPVPRKAPPANFKRGKLRQAIYAALRDGPLTGPEIVERVCAASGLAYKAMYRSVYSQLDTSTNRFSGWRDGDRKGPSGPEPAGCDAGRWRLASS